MKDYLLSIFCAIFRVFKSLLSSGLHRRRKYHAHIEVDIEPEENQCQERSCQSKEKE